MRCSPAWSISAPVLGVRVFLRGETPCQLHTTFPVSPPRLLLSPLLEEPRGAPMLEKALPEPPECLGRGLPVQNGAGHGPETPPAPGGSGLSGTGQNSPQDMLSPRPELGWQEGSGWLPPNCKEPPAFRLSKPAAGERCFGWCIGGAWFYTKITRQKPSAETGPVSLRVRDPTSALLAKNTPSSRCRRPQGCHRGRPGCHRSSAVARQRFGCNSGQVQAAGTTPLAQAAGRRGSTSPKTPVPKAGGGE